MVPLLSWVASLLLRYDPRFPEWSIIVELGWILAAIALLALIGKKWNAFAMFSLLLVVTIVSDNALFAYQKTASAVRGTIFSSRMSTRSRWQRNGFPNVTTTVGKSSAA